MATVRYSRAEASLALSLSHTTSNTRFYSTPKFKFVTQTDHAAEPTSLQLTLQYANAIHWRASKSGFFKGL